MKNFSIILSGVAVILAAVSLTVSLKSSSGVSADAVNKALLEQPKMVVDALQAFQIQQQEEQMKEAQAALDKHINEINSDENAPFIGPKDAKIVVVEFFDFSCGYCKRLAPAIEKVMADNSDVKFIFKPLSFVAPISNYQAKAALAAHKQGKFAEFYKATLDYSGLMDESSVDELAKKIGLDFDTFKKDLNSDEVSKNLEDIASVAQNAQINGVPMVLINGKQVQTMSAIDLQKAIDSNK